MGKLVAFTGLNGERVWVNPSVVARIYPEGEGATVYLSVPGLAPVLLREPADVVAETLNRNLGWRRRF
ncbi:hypothetical protein [Caulobacter mirabilis]|uniref:Uncharacterized protein n=1 Tax=Caulobacter mirabilis TaxID=69666 RepID=A0A2D2B0W8_9CAUL|nr:hypothetical protein [Caulobacter mirabilis]ATQ43901.1 hypothetical protein CSW64_16605 [Caulobacter mirabilis]